MKKKNLKSAALTTSWRSFLSLCRETRSSEELDELFDLFFTIEEKENVAQRYMIIKHLLDGKKTQREMANVFKVSIAQITRGSNAIKILDDQFKGLLEKKIKASK